LLQHEGALGHVAEKERGVLAPERAEEG
jgi:hypothetical protein